MSLRIAFLGLGIMGGGMARRLLAAGFPLVVYNRSREKAVPFAEAGARVAETPAEAAAGADLVVGMVADDAASRALWLGAEGALAGAARGATLVECSTLTVGWVRELGQAAESKGCQLLDAPVTGSKAAAAGGELNFIVGGPEGGLLRARPALEAMGRSVTHVGPAGSGALLKLINNFVAGVQVAAFAEAFAWIERTGLDREQALSFLMAGAIGSPVTKTVAARMEAEDFTPNFFLKLMAKDLGYASGEAAKAGQPLALAAAALERYREAEMAGWGGQDMAAVVRPMRPGATGG